MIDLYYAIGVWLWGAILGLIYFGGLWLTVRRLALVKRQAVWLLGSLAIRNILAVIGFYPVVKLGWLYALIGLIGFIMVRWLAIRRISPLPRKQNIRKDEDVQAGRGL